MDEPLHHNDPRFDIWGALADHFGIERYSDMRRGLEAESEEIRSDSLRDERWLRHRRLLRDHPRLWDAPDLPERSHREVRNNIVRIAGYVEMMAARHGAEPTEEWLLEQVALRG